MEEKYSLIPYKGTQISLYSDDRNDYVSLTDVLKVFKRNRKTISVWLKSVPALKFLNVWEKKNNPNYLEPNMEEVMKVVRKRNGFSVEAWIEMTNAIGIFAKSGKGEHAGTYAHKDIAIKFAGWLSPEFELHLVEEIQKLKDLERQKNSYELLSQEQVLSLVRLKEVFKYVAHQGMIEDAHKDFFAANSTAKNPFSEFNNWRNEILEISRDKIDKRIKEYCIKNNIALTTKLLSRTKRDKILLLDSYEAVKIAVWDFLTIEGNVNALNLANLVEKMIRIEKGEVLRKNETDLFHSKQDFGEFQNFEKFLDSMPKIKTAREVLFYRKQLEQKSRPKALSNFDATLKAVMTVPKPTNDLPEA